MKQSFLAVVAILLWQFSNVSAQDTDWALREGFAIEKIATDLFLPVNIAFASLGSEPEDPLLYVTELFGQIKVITNDGTVHLYADSLLNYDSTAEFPGSGELGVIGIVVDTLTGDLFVTMVYYDEGIKNKVVRAYSSEDGLQADSIVTVLDGIAGPAFSHQIQQVTIGPDGKLYVQVGDGFEGSSAADDNDLRGKVLRMNRDGSIPSDNPDSTSYVYAKGLRNPFGGRWRESDSTLYVSDNGPNRDDRLVRVKPGSDLGWPDSLQWGAIHIWNPPVSPVAIDFATAAAFPDSLAGHLFVGLAGKTYRKGSDVPGKRIESLELDDVGNVVSHDTLLQYTGSGFSTVVGLAFGPDGLYFTDLWGEDGFNDEGITQANVYRIFPKRESTVGVRESGPRPTMSVAVYPNPSRDRAYVGFELERPSAVSIRVFDALGREALRVLDEFKQAGPHKIDIESGLLTPGAYFCRIETETGSAGRSFVVR